MENAIAKFREEIASITYAITAEIVSIMKKHPGKPASFVELSSSPVLLEAFQEEQIATLDSVEYIPEKNKLILYGSNSWGNDYSYSVNINGNAFTRHDPYLLTEVLEYLVKYENLMFEPTAHE